MAAVCLDPPLRRPPSAPAPTYHRHTKFLAISEGAGFARAAGAFAGFAALGQAAGPIGGNVCIPVGQAAGPNSGNIGVPVG
eukprot:3297059-Prorocentrum_lima.AAC.1